MRAMSPLRPEHASTESQAAWYASGGSNRYVPGGGAKGSTHPHAATTMAAALRAWPAKIGDHPSVASARGAMREEAVAVVRATGRRDRHLFDAQVPGLAREERTQVEVDRRGAFGEAKARRDFRTYFIARATNAYSTMHYNIAALGEAAPLQQLHAPAQHSGGGAAPPGVQQGDRALLGHREIHRNAVG